MSTNQWVSRQCTSYDWKILRKIRTYFVIFVNSRICAFELIFKNLNCDSRNFTSTGKPSKNLQITVPNQTVGSIFADEHPNKKSNGGKNNIIINKCTDQIHVGKLILARWYETTQHSTTVIRSNISNHKNNFQIEANK